MAGERLRIVSGAGAGKEIALEGDFVVGRGEAGMGNLAGDSEISRRHARFRLTDQGQVVVEDLGSTNGTYVGGSRLTAPHILSPGDQVKLGRTVLLLEGDGQPTTATGTPPAAPVAAPQATPVAAASPPVQPRAPSPGFAGGPIGGPPGRETSARGRRLRGITLGLVVLLLIAGAVVLIVSVSGGKSTATGASVASDCGANIGKDGQVAYVAYVESNIAASGKNSVLLMPFRAGGMKPLAVSQCSTGGSGSTDLTDSGVLDANDQVIVNQQHTLLFAVNQGSDTIAVFHIQRSGALQPVAGSPFPSGGKGPSSLGLSGSTLVVSNKAQDGVRDLKTVAPNYTTFTVGSDGRLTPVAGSSISADPGSSPTDASVPVRGGVAFGTEESGPIRSFSVNQQGVLTQAPGSPYDPPPRAFAAGFDPAKKFALGVATHPTQNFVYMGLPTIPALAVFAFDPTTGALTFISSTLVQGAYLPCWIQITKDGHWLYTSNADTDNITVFDISNPIKPRQIQTLTYQTAGNPWNISLSPDDKFLYGITPRDTLKVPEGEGNTAHVMLIGADGKLTELNAASPAKIPVPKTANPQGIAVIKPGA
jgi:hypothetical protein